MFELTLAAGPTVEVRGRQHVWRYANDGSLANPLESTYAAIAGCAGVYAKKACRELGVADSGIRIGVRPVARPGHLVPARIVTTVEFPDHFDAAQRRAVLGSIDRCAVKAIVQEGASIEFSVEESLPA
jgi:ribosomal protein S12 methylthiotransferase accessory factor